MRRELMYGRLEDDVDGIFFYDLDNVCKYYGHIEMPVAVELVARNNTCFYHADTLLKYINARIDGRCMLPFKSLTEIGFPVTETINRRQYETLLEQLKHYNHRYNFPRYQSETFYLANYYVWLYYNYKLERYDTWYRLKSLPTIIEELSSYEYYKGSAIFGNNGRYVIVDKEIIKCCDVLPIQSIIYNAHFNIFEIYLPSGYYAPAKYMAITLATFSSAKFFRTIAPYEYYWLIGKEIFNTKYEKVGDICD